MSYDQALQEWAFTWKQEHLSKQVRTLISQATDDLYLGPDGINSSLDEEESYPGFTTACRLISQALEDLPSNLYMDIQSGYISETEPQAEKCDVCEGEGTVIKYKTADLFQDDEEDHEKCQACNGGGYFQPEEYYYMDRVGIRCAIVGKELSAYLR